MSTPRRSFLATVAAGISWITGGCVKRPSGSGTGIGSPLAPGKVRFEQILEAPVEDPPPDENKE